MAERSVHHCRLIVGLLLALGAGLTSAYAPASAEGEASDAGETVTTVLHPGWNMVGWIGDDAPVTAIFDAVPAAESVAAWDADGRRYVWARGGESPPGALRDLTTGMGLWVRLGGDTPVEWQQQRTDDYVLLELRAGRNLVAWTGESGEFVREVTRRLGSTFVQASRWNAESGRQEQHRAGSFFAPNTLHQLKPGDAAWIELAADARWWQSGNGRTTFRFPDAVRPLVQDRVRRELAGVLAFFAERHGIEPPVFSVAVDLEYERFAAVRGREILLGKSVLDYDRLRVVLAHEYFHILQQYLQKKPAGEAGTWSPAWLVEGAATFAGEAYERDRWGGSPLAIRSHWQDLSANIEAPLADLESGHAFHEVGAPAYSLGALAVEWVMGRAAATAAREPLSDGWATDREDDAYIRYHRALATADRWEDAFEAVFGISVDDFYAAFEHHRAAIWPPLAHQTDNIVRPIVVATEQVAQYLVERIQAQMDEVHALTVERFGAPPTEYTVYVGPFDEYTQHLARLSGDARWDDGARATRLAVASDRSCSEGGRGWIVFRSNCANRPESSHYINAHLRMLLAGTSRSDPAPAWIEVGGAAYIDLAYRAADAAAFKSEISSYLLLAGARGVRLELLDEPQRWLNHDDRALSALAVDWLLRRAGEQALFEYFRLLPRDSDAADSAASWEAAFEEAFGLTIGDFYADFEANRVGLARAVVRARSTLFPVEVVAADLRAALPSNPATLEGAALLDDSRASTYSVVLGADGSPLPGVWVVAPNEGYTVTGAFISGSGPKRRLIVTRDDGAFLMATVREPGPRGAVTVIKPSSWEVIVARGCRFGGDDLSVRQRGPTAFEIRLPTGSSCDDS